MSEHLSGNEAGSPCLVKAVAAIPLDPAQGAGQLGLSPEFAGLVGLSVGLEKSLARTGVLAELGCFFL